MLDSIVVRLGVAPWLLLAVFSASASGRPAAAQEAEVLVALRQAEQAAAENRTEEALVALLDAERRLVPVEDALVRAELAERLAALRDEVDPYADRIRKAATSAAEQLVEVAGSYAAAGWRRSARALLELARRLAPSVAEGPLAELEAVAAGEGEDVVPAGSFEAWFGGGEDIEGPVGWSPVEGGIHPPPSTTDEVAFFLSGRRARPGRIRMAAEVHAGTGGCVGLVFGYHHLTAFHAAHFTFVGSRVGVTLRRREAEDFVELGGAWLPRPGGGAAAPVPIALEVEDGVAVLRVGNASERVALGASPGVDDGFLGLQCWRYQTERFEARFENVRVDAEEVR